MEFTVAAKQRSGKSTESTLRGLGDRMSHHWKRSSGFQMYRDCWHAVADHAERIVSGAQEQLFNRTCIYLKEHTAALDTHPALPVASLVLGANAADQRELFERLRVRLQNGRFGCALLSASACDTATQMTDLAAQALLGDSGADQQQLRWLLREYRDSQKSNAVQKMRCKPLGFVVLLPTLEAFPVAAVHDFVLICASYRRQGLPLALVLGVCWQSQSMLPRTAVDCLHAHQLHWPSPKQLFYELVERLFLEETLLFRLGPRVFCLLYELFFNHQLSVQSFLRHIQLCLMLHFLDNSTSFLCAEPVRMTLLRNLKSNPEQLEILKCSPSYQSYLQSLSEEMRQSLAKFGVAEFGDHVCGLIRSVLDSDRCYRALLRVMWRLVRDLYCKPLGTRMAEFHFRICSPETNSNPSNSDAFRQIYSQLRMQNTAQIQSFLADSIYLLQDIGEAILSSPVTELMENLKTFLRNFKNEAENQAEIDAMRNIENLAAPDLNFVKKLSKKETAESLKAKLLRASEMKKQASYFESERERLIDFLDKAFSELLQLPVKLPFADAFYFDQLDRVKPLLLACPEKAVFSTLTSANPLRLHSAVEWCAATNVRISPSKLLLPAACAFQTSCLFPSKTVALSDWFAAYQRRSTQQPSVDEGSSAVRQPSTSRKRKIEEKGTQSQSSSTNHSPSEFLCAVAEMESLGLVRVTARQNQLAQRLFWTGLRH